MEQTAKRITGLEAFFLIVGSLFVEIFLDFIPVVSTIASICAFFLLWFYFKMKGVEQMANIVGNTIDIIPIIEYLPAMTAGVVITILSDWSPEVKKAAKGVEKTTGADRFKKITGGAQ